MDDMTARQAFTPTGRTPTFTKLLKRFPTSAYLRRVAPRNVPLFAFEYGDTGAGDDVGVADNWAALDAVKVAARYGVMPLLPPVDVELFGRRYAAPIGIAPMGGPSLVWPGADLLLAKAAQEARVPYTLGVAGGATIEQVAEVAPDVFWLQLYRFAHNDHEIGFDLVRRAQAAEVKVLALTLDVPVRTMRSRESYAGLGGVFRPSPRMIYEMMVRPKWLLALLRHGYPRFATIAQYAKSNNTNEVIEFARREMGGAFSWEEVARYRDAWKGPMVVKGILHPADAEKAVALGCEGVWVSNHGGRQIEALMPTDRRLAGDRVGRRQARHRRIRQRHPLRPGRDARARARCRRRLCRQVVPVGGGGAWRRRPGLSDRPLHRGAARLARPDRRAVAGRGARGLHPPSGGSEILARFPIEWLTLIERQTRNASLPTRGREPVKLAARSKSH